MFVRTVCKYGNNRNKERSRVAAIVERIPSRLAHLPQSTFTKKKLIVFFHSEQQQVRCHDNTLVLCWSAKRSRDWDATERRWMTFFHGKGQNKIERPVRFVIFECCCC